jgi:hypothetical protein
MRISVDAFAKTYISDKLKVELFVYPVFDCPPCYSYFLFYSYFTLSVALLYAVLIARRCSMQSSPDAAECKMAICEGSAVWERYRPLSSRLQRLSARAAPS